jgi:hypothetical protein
VHNPAFLCISFQHSRHPAETITMPEIFSNLRKEITKRKLAWLHEVMPYIYTIAGFLLIYLIHHANIIK